MGESSPPLKIVFYAACLPPILIQSLPPWSSHTPPTHTHHITQPFTEQPGFHSAGPPLPQSGCVKTRVVSLVASVGREVDLGESEHHCGKASTSAETPAGVQARQSEVLQQGGDAPAGPGSPGASENSVLGARPHWCSCSACPACPPSPGADVGA